ncbi:MULTISPECIES: cellulose synthase complex outer membrane protein BcsC [Aeromonas]|uniref:cellulose synthase complex outer membrane protein BcsC n=1 Tax=Aeromonas TaxID=642 RepID=UPI0004D3CE8C|nr:MULTISPECIES: cellulose synthase complex outer membrane protein BcsC [Aeromonas]KDV02245.1 cellulose synthase [Aeromonas sp. HZM]MBP4061690.1 cellulose biosynthesis protein BcsC [Aeromonas sp. Prich7-2]MDH0027822.1 cellulose synthase complex outer membrane protein BcsC [Aeromonas caviae]MDH0352624.1 cellulose synthase complex outer membrane protein BcsC [Aeromonas caviae]MDH1079574.1 cellulose synthase complex outer membrane protein BcsC [Aeromonas caviae]
MSGRVTLGCLLACLMSGALAQGTVQPVAWLLEQVRIGEARGREDLVSNSLYSLSLVEPDHPELLAAQARQALRQGKVKEAGALLARLGKQDPDSALYRQGMANLALNEPARRQQLQQARLLTSAGRLEEAERLYRSLFSGDLPPNLDVAVDYALLQTRIPAMKAKGLAALEALNRQYPGEPRVRGGLARLYLAEGRRQGAQNLLREMARDPYQRDEAAEIWLADIESLPIGPGSIAALQEYMVLFGEGDTTKAEQLLAAQEEKWASPAYRARQSALASTAGGGASISRLQRALAANPGDPELMGALGQAYSRNDQRALAIAQFERVLAHPEVTDKDKWRSLLATNRYWLLVSQGRSALEREQWDEAATLYRRAIAQDGREPEAWLGLGDSERGRHRDADAESAYRKALAMGSARERALARLFDLYKEQDPARALALLEQQGTPGMQAEGRRLKAGLLQEEADQLDRAGKVAAALRLREQALALTPEEVWLAYRVADTRARLGEAGSGERLLRERLAARPQDATLRYATALYLSGQDKTVEARGVLAAIPRSGWTQDMDALDRRLARGEVLARARARHEAGDDEGAERLLQPLQPDEEVSLMLAEWSTDRGAYALAEQRYQEVLARTPQQPEARLGMAELAQARGDLAKARHWLPAWPVSPLPPEGANYYRRVANLYQALGEGETARAIFTDYEPLVAMQPASQQTALFWRDAARQRVAEHDVEGALVRDRKGLVAAGLAPREDLEGGELTRLARSQDGEGWLASGLRSDLDRHYRQSQTTFSLDSDYWGSSGTGGYSDLRALTQMAQLDTPLAGGTAFGRLELVDMDAGDLPDSPYRAQFGTCAARDCRGDAHQQSRGTTLAAGWQRGAWAFDLGTTPLGFEVVDWVGGATLTGDWHTLGWGMTLSRRPVSSSLLSYGGTVDPGTGISWGGVRANGIRLDLSRDLGGAVGFWGSAQQHLLTGKNVPDNWRTRLMGGGYYKFVNETHRRASVGLSTMLWHYQQDLGGYTLGQGGYYSPQGYFSLSVPVSYRQRTSDWSWELGGSGSWSYARTDDSRRYPLEGLLPAGLPDRNAPVKGGSSSGFGYTLNGVVEHRLTEHWRIGGRVDIQQADDYAPSHVTLFLRYTFKPWQGDLDMPPRPLTPYADFD